MPKQEPKSPAPRVTKGELPGVIAGAISATAQVLSDEAKKAASATAKGANGALDAALESSAKALRAGLRKIDRLRKQRKG